MKIKLNDRYKGPLSKDTVYEAVKGTKDYGIVDGGDIWGVRIENADEVDEFEEEFSKLCKAYAHHKIGFSSVRRATGMSEISMIKTEKDLYMQEEGYPNYRVCDNEDIPALILALLKLLDE